MSRFVNKTSILYRAQMTFVVLTRKTNECIRDLAAEFRSFDYDVRSFRGPLFINGWLTMNADEMDSEQSLAESHSSIVAIQQGKPMQLELLASQLRPYLKHVIRNEIASFPGFIRDDESDIVQQTLTRAVERVETFRGSSVSEWRLWLAAIARNQVRDSKRYWNAKVRSVRHEVDIEGNVSELDGDITSPSSILQQDELASQLARSITQLSEPHRQMIDWRVQQELSHAEIAERLGISIDASRQRAKTAMDALRKVWHEASSLRPE